MLRWCWTLPGVLALAGCIWVLGPLLPALEPAPPRLALALAVLAVGVGAGLLLDYRRRRRETALADGIAGGAVEAEAVRAQHGDRAGAAETRARPSRLSV